MFDGVPDQFHQFIASRTSLPLPLSFPLHGTSPNFPLFDPYPSSHQTLQPNLLHQLHHHQLPTNKDEEKEETTLLSANLELERERSIPECINPWSNDEVLTLLRVRSSMENWFPDFTWEHVSRKLAELGFKRSAEKCKEKFEEESRNFNNISYNKNYRFFSELEEVYHSEKPPVLAEKNQTAEKTNVEQDKIVQSLEEDSRNETVGGPPQESKKLVAKSRKNNKRKREQKFEMFRGFCRNVVNRIMAQQEEMHNKLLEDIVKRDEEKIAREEAWKKQEMDKINKEIELREHEQAIASDRQVTIIEFLKKFTSTSENQCFGMRNEDLLKLTYSSNSPISPPLIPPQNPNSTCQQRTQNKLESTSSSTKLVSHQNPSSLPNQNKQNMPTSLTETLTPQNLGINRATNIPNVPNSSAPAQASENPNATITHNSPLAPTPSSVHKARQNPNSGQNEKEDIGKRWPRDEVLALINLRCSLFSSGEGKEVTKGSLWERISQGMLELGYKRSAKRCKEKWENINKYFRKTKDVNKKRSVDSRTCPYFHQLRNLYSQGALVAPADGQENHLTSTENNSAISKTSLKSSQGGSNDAIMHVAGGGKSEIQVPAVKFQV